MTTKGHNPAMRPARFAAVNLISDPIHRYIELTKRLSAAHAAELGFAAVAAGKFVVLLMTAMRLYPP